MAKKYVLIPLRTFKEVCSSVKISGDTITGVVKNIDEAKESKKGEIKQVHFFIEQVLYFL